MKRPRALLIGDVGQVGWELKRALAPISELYNVDFPEIDLRSGDSLRHWVAQARPEIIVNAAAYTAVDKAETEPELAMKINAVAPGILAEEARKTGALLVHYSTDYVFDGSKSNPYLETDRVNPVNMYGRSKSAGDDAVLSAGCACLIFRLCWVYGPRGQNFLLTMMRLAREKEKLRVVRDQFGCPTWSRLIAEATTFALVRILGEGDLRWMNGVYHMASAGVTSWHGFAEAILDEMDGANRKCKVVEAISTLEYPTPARRPAYSVLGCDKLEQTFGLRLPDWREALNLVLEKAA
jgi:dTDP-4-dehydrorhamnose reductase